MPISGHKISGEQGALLTADEKDGILRRRIFLILGGKIVYDDVFGKSHETTFCVFYSQKVSYTEAPLHPSKSDGWSGCPTKQTAN